MYMHNVSQADPDKLYDWACNHENDGSSHYPGMFYEDGIKDTIS